MPLYLGNTLVTNCNWAGIGGTYLYLGTTEVYPNYSIPLPDYWINVSSIKGFSDGDIISNGDFVDQSENNYITNVTGSPTYKTGGQNLLSYVLFNGSTDALFVPTFQCNLWTRTIFMVFKYLGSTNSILMEFGSNAQGAANQFYIATQATSNNYACVWSSNSNFTWLNFSPYNYLTNNPIIFSYQMNWTTTTSKPQVGINTITQSIYRNGSTLSRGNQSGTNQLNLFARNAAEFFTNIEFYELIFYNRITTTEENNNIYFYLNSKYGI